MSQFPRSAFSPLRTLGSRKSLRASLALALAGLIFLMPFGRAASARQSSAPASGVAKASASSGFVDNHELGDGQTGDNGVDSFIIEMKDGVTTCRDASPAEVPLTLPREGDIRTPVAPAKVTVVQQSEQELQITAQGADNINTPLTINLVSLSQLNADPNKAAVIAAFQRAAAVWTNRIKSPTTVTVNIDYGPNSPGGASFPSGVLGSTSSRRVLIDYPGFLTNLKASANGAAESAIYNTLPASFVPTDVGNGAVVSVARTLARSLGIPYSSTAPEDATIGFNSNFSFDFNPDDGITSGTTDFVAVAAHEIGHALGFTSGAGVGATANVSVWDIFRFRPGTGSSTLGSGQRIMSIGGGNQVYFTGQTFTTAQAGNTTELGLSTGGPDAATTGGGDGRQSSHWKADELSGGVFIGIMDPTIAKGVREDATENDFSALETMGWDLTGNAVIPPPPPAPPAPANDNFANAQFITGSCGSVGGTNVGATKETGETNNPDSPTSQKSVWYQWQAPVSGSVTINTGGSSFDTVLAVYTGSSFGTLQAVANNDDAVANQDFTSTVTFNATAGTVYRIEVNGFNNNGSLGDIGSFKLSWSQGNNCVQLATAPAGATFSFSVSEGQLFIPISVTAPSGSTVKYQTSDTTDVNFQCNPATAGQVTGVASRKCDYHIASGRLRFGPGETSKNIVLSLVNDVYVEGNESFTLTFNISGVDFTANITITDDDTPSKPNPIDNTHFFVRQLYVDLLSREPDQAGWDGWTSRIDLCGQPGQAPPPCDRVTVGGDGFLRSAEFFDRQFFVLRLYRTGFGRILQYSEVGDLAYVSGFLSASDLELNKQDLVADIMTRSEFTTKYNGLSNASFVDTLLQTAAVTVPQSVRDGWVTSLGNGSKTRAQVFREVSERTEVSNKYLHEAQVVSAYYGFFTRNPDGAYLNYLQRLDSGEINLGDLANAFINAQEYRQRFGF